MSTAQATRPAKQKPWRSRHAFDPTRPTLAGLIGRYLTPDLRRHHLDRTIPVAALDLPQECQ